MQFLIFILRRTGQAAIVMTLVALVAFALFQYVGDPVTQMLGPDATQSERERVRQELGLDRPATVQFVKFLGSAIQGDFGLSLKQGRPVADLLRERVPATLELSAIAAIIAIGLGIPLGVYTAIRRQSAVTQIILAASLIGNSLPTFLIGLLHILLFGVSLGVLPTFGRGETVDLGGWSTGLLTADGWRHILLPAITLSLYQLTLIVRLVRAEMLEVLRADFIRFARARGIPKTSIYFRHALQNALVPVTTVVGLQLGSIIAFGVITETVFQWPGMGLLFIQAVSFADIPVMAAYLCFVALIFVAINILVDAIYLIVDPRLRRE